MKSLDDWGIVCNAISSSNGFWDDEVDINFALSKLALLHSEVSETLEAIRKEQGDQAIMEELADTFIRLVDFVAGIQKSGWVSPDISFEDVVEQKVQTNALRPRKHGNLA